MQRAQMGGAPAHAVQARRGLVVEHADQVEVAAAAMLHLRRQVCGFLLRQPIGCGEPEACLEAGRKLLECAPVGFRAVQVEQHVPRLAILMVLGIRRDGALQSGRCVLHPPMGVQQRRFLRQREGLRLDRGGEVDGGLHGAAVFERRIPELTAARLTA